MCRWGDCAWVVFYRMCPRCYKELGQIGRSQPRFCRRYRNPCRGPQFNSRRIKKYIKARRPCVNCGWDTFYNFCFHAGLGYGWEKGLTRREDRGTALLPLS